jgi:hypothetical protein
MIVDPARRTAQIYDRDGARDVACDGVLGHVTLPGLKIELASVFA